METKVFFDRDAYSREVSMQESAASALTRMLKNYELLDNGKPTIEILAGIGKGGFRSFEAKYIEDQLSISGNNPLIRHHTEELAIMNLHKFREYVENMGDRNRFAMINADISLLAIEGDKVVFTGSEKLKKKYTYTAKTDNQKRFVEHIGKIEEDLKILKEFIGENPIIGCCYWVDSDGELRYNEAAILEVK